MKSFHVMKTDGAHISEEAVMKTVKREFQSINLF